MFCLFLTFSTCATIGISKNNTGNVPWKFTIARPYIYTIYNVYYKNLNATHFFCLTSPKNLVESKRLNALAEERVNSRSLRPARQAAEKVCVACRAASDVMFAVMWGGCQRKQLMVCIHGFWRQLSSSELEQDKDTGVPNLSKRRQPSSRVVCEDVEQVQTQVGNILHLQMH